MSCLIHIESESCLFSIELFNWFKIKINGFEITTECPKKRDSWEMTWISSLIRDLCRNQNEILHIYGNLERSKKTGHILELQRLGQFCDY